MRAALGRRRLFSLGAVCAAPVCLTWLSGVASASVAKSARYALVENDSGEANICTGLYDHSSGIVVPFARGRNVSVRALIRGLDRSLFERTEFLADGTHLAWVHARGLWYGDLLTGRSRRLGTVGSAEEVSSIAVGPGGRSALVVAVRGGRSRTILIARARGRVLRREVASASGALSADGRFAWYQTGSGDRFVVRSLTSGYRLRRLAAAVLSWSPAGHRLAYVFGNNLRVLDMSRGQALEVPLPATDRSPRQGPAWSDDGRYFLVNGTVVAIAAGRILQLPPLPSDDALFDWRPGHGHQLLRTAFGAGSGHFTDLVNVDAPRESWSRQLEDLLDWSPNGRWLADQDSDPVVVLDGASGNTVDLPASLKRASTGFQRWLGEDTLQLDGRRVLRIARPPSWRPRVLARARAGHHLYATRILSATSAGLSLLARAFRPRAQPRDCP
jgi:hypothetical protein